MRIKSSGKTGSDTSQLSVVDILIKGGRKRRVNNVFPKLFPQDKQWLCVRKENCKRSVGYLEIYD